MAAPSILDVMDGTDARKLYWKRVRYHGADCVCPTSNTRMIFNAIRKELRREHQRGQAHGNLVPENIRFPYGNDVRYPELTNATGGLDFMADYGRIADILESVLNLNNPYRLNFDPETQSFINKLRHPPVIARKSELDCHYWYGSWRDRARLFIEAFSFSYLNVQKTSICGSSIDIPSDLPQGSSMRRVFVHGHIKAGRKKFMYNSTTSDLFRFIRDYIIHGSQATQNTKNESGLLSELFEAFPSLMVEIYNDFELRGVENLLLID